METKNIQSRSYDTLWDIGPLRFVSNFVGNPTFVEYDYLGNNYIYLTNPRVLIGLKSKPVKKNTHLIIGKRPH